MTSGSFGGYKEWLKFLFGSENLDDLPTVDVAPRRPSFFSGLLKSEVLPFDDAGSEGRFKSRTPGLLASEPLALDDLPPSRRVRASFAATLFARETLPEDQVPGPGSAGRGRQR